jgi:hypothetical protein
LLFIQQIINCIYYQSKTRATEQMSAMPQVPSSIYKAHGINSTS